MSGECGELSDRLGAQRFSGDSEETRQCRVIAGRQASGAETRSAPRPDSNAWVVLIWESRSQAELSGASPQRRRVLRFPPVRCVR